jgi:hypothetical protein
MAQYLPETTVGLIMKLAKPLIRGMFHTSPEDLSSTVEQGVLEYPTHAYHVRVPWGYVLSSCVFNLQSWLASGRGWPEHPFCVSSFMLLGVVGPGRSSCCSLSA